MTSSGDPFRLPAEVSNAGTFLSQESIGQADARLPLLNLSAVRTRMDTLQCFLSQSVNTNTLLPRIQMDMVSAEIASAIQQIIVNGAALLSSTQRISDPPSPNPNSKPPDCPPDPVPKPAKKTVKVNEEEEEKEVDEDGDCEIVEIDAVELLAEHIHFCEICGKGFKRDANLRMHMRAHGNQYKTPEALSKKGGVNSEPYTHPGRKTRFSCPYEGCNRNRKHRRFRPLKSVICVRNHFKRSHCPKMYSCNRCHKKSFSVLADLKSHLKHCGGEEKRWKCSCGNSFSRKDKLFGHMALFEGHMPAVAEEAAAGEQEERSTSVVAMEEDEAKEVGFEEDCLSDRFFEGLLDGFDSIENYCFQDVFRYTNAI